MATVFDVQEKAKNNPNINVEMVANTMKIQEVLIKFGVGKKASYKIDRPSEQRDESFKLAKDPKIITRIF